MNSTFKLIASLVCHKAALWLAVKFIASQVCHRGALVVGCGIERVVKPVGTFVERL